MLRRVLLGLFWDTYDHLGSVIVSNLLWFIFNLPSFIILVVILSNLQNLKQFFFLLPIPILILPTTTAGLYHLSFQWILGKDASIKEMFLGMKIYFKRSIILFILQTFIIILAFINVGFYLRLAKTLGFVSLILTGLSVWVGIFLLLQSIYLFPVMVQKNFTVRKTFFSALYLLLDNLFFSVFIGLIILLVFLFCFFSRVGFFLFMMIIIALLANGALFELQEKYDKKEKISDQLPEQEKPTSWHQILEKKETPAKKWRHANRGWKDIFRPWDL